MKNAKKQVVPYQLSDIEHLALTAHSEEEKLAAALYGQLYEKITGKPLTKLSKRAEETVIDLIEREIESDSTITVKGFAVKYHIPIHVLRRWISRLPKIKAVWDELEASRIETAKERVIAVAAGDAALSERNDVGMDISVIGAALRMYDKTAKARQELSGDQTKPVQIIITSKDSNA